MRATLHKTSLLGLFGVLKLLTLISPIFAASKLTNSQYGLVELSLSIGLISSVFVLFGSTNLISYGHIKNDFEKVYAGIRHSFSVSLLFSLFSIMSVMLFSIEICMFLSVIGVFIGQFSLSGYYKSIDKGYISFFVDVSVYALLLIVVLLMVMLSYDFKLIALSFSYLSIFFSLWLFLIWRRIKVCKIQISTYLLPNLFIVMSAFLALLLVNIPKILGGYFGLELVAEFSLYFRWAAIGLVIHQFVTIIYFKKIYTLDVKNFSRVVVFIAVGVLIVSVVVFSILVSFGSYFNNIGLAVPSLNFGYSSIIISTIVLWSISSALEGYLYREDKQIVQLQYVSFGIVTFFIVIGWFFMFSEVTLFALLLAWFFSYVVQVVFQVKYCMSFFNMPLGFVYVLMFLLVSHNVLILTL